MADNYVTNAGSGGATFASDDISGVQFPRVKLTWGADATANDASTANPLPTQTIDESSTVFAGGSGVTPKFAVISDAASGDNSVVAAVSGKKIRVLSYVLVSSGTVNAKWRRGTTDISGAMPLVANVGVSATCAGVVGLFETAATEALQINLSAAIGVYGHLTYIEV